MAAPPWLMWGSAQTAQLIVPGGSTTGLTNGGGQIARIDYSRPETWSFFLAATLTDVQYVGGGVPLLTLVYGLNIGLGRSAIQLPAFETYKWNLPAEVGVTRYSQSVQGPLRFAADVAPNQIDKFVAQSINLAWSASLFVPAGAQCSASVEVHGYFAPRTHIRPDWFIHEGAQFKGGETDGL